MIAKILVGVDGSEKSEKAMNYALEVAEKFSASVLILNVFQSHPETGNQLDTFQQAPAFGYPQETVNYPANTASLVKDLRKIHEGILNKALESATKLKPAIKITVELKEGDESSQIVETATKGQFDLIVIGHRGNSKIEELFLGSTSERVAHLARCAVLIIK